MRLTSPAHRAVLADAWREAEWWSLGRMRALCGVRFALVAYAYADAYANADAYACAVTGPPPRPVVE